MNRPIGIFDSGIGGLTIARAVKDQLPHENLVYFGDTHHLPYGDKPITELQSYALRICDFLLHKQCKVIVIACNSVAAVATDVIHARVGKQATVLSVIAPMIDHLKRYYQGRSIGLIGTQQTVQSGVYEKELCALQADIRLQTLATPLLAPMSEVALYQPLHNGQDILTRYLQHPSLQQIEALVLGCTHYHVIKTKIQHFYQHQLEVIDATTLTALYLRRFLAHHQLVRTRASAKDYFAVSAMTQAFSKALQFFFGSEAYLEQIAI